MPVSFEGWTSEIKENWEEDPKRAVLQGLWTTYLGAWLTVSTRYDPADNIFDKDWDALIILDACRVDALKEVAPEYSFIEGDKIDSTWSLGSGSLEFMCKNFTTEYRDEINETVYVGANGYINRAFVDHTYAPPVAIPFGWPKNQQVHANEFKELTNLWETRYEEDLRNVPPMAMTDASIGAGRRHDEGRFIFHYSQPHTPYLATAIDEGRPVTDQEHNPWPDLRDGDLEYGTVWEWYLENLRLSLDCVEVLLNNLDVEDVIITADHGEAFGEWGIHGHPTGFPFPPVKKVPWVRVSATDKRTHQHSTIDGEANNCSNIDKETINQQLKDLGYKV
ncbi:hypothetical protein PM033_10605 [Halorubrum ezzemoulense]|uniref:hypothetical protein n=1 Tax=Halorubrum ezzemoulense TaxID=337243 RepID=UPI00232D380B|nr:hypothetical protein [Halorubrum ezzemoulense]MDB2252224.1 hypothetical protein [Halorubrum ezzemoulense]